MKSDESCRNGIDVARESVLSFAEAARFVGKLKGTKRVAFQTLFRWATKGCRRIVLDTIFVGGSRCTSVEALQRFFTALTVARAAQALDPSRPAAGSGPAEVIPALIEPGDVDAILRQAGIVRDDKEAA
ncbi:MAG: DUF1580 domain-containing protein [Planctomycetia bacterium]|nr:DUF1580 domain-containing protein [Planctomycetia bacterium]